MFYLIVGISWIIQSGAFGCCGLRRRKWKPSGPAIIPLRQTDIAV